MKENDALFERLLKSLWKGFWKDVAYYRKRPERFCLACARFVNGRCQENQELESCLYWKMWKRWAREQEEVGVSGK